MYLPASNISPAPTVCADLLLPMNWCTHPDKTISCMIFQSPLRMMLFTRSFAECPDISKTVLTDFYAHKGICSNAVLST